MNNVQGKEWYYESDVKPAMYRIRRTGGLDYSRNETVSVLCWLLNIRLTRSSSATAAAHLAITEESTCRRHSL